MPTAALEDWRYSRIDELDLDRYSLAPQAAAPSTGSASMGPVLALTAAAGADAVVLTTVNGRLAGPFPQVEGVIITDLSSPGAAPPDRRPGDVAGEPDAFSFLNAALAPTPLLVEIDGAFRRPLVVVHWIEPSAAGQMALPRTTIRLRRGAEATVLEIVASSGHAPLVVPVTELDLPEGAHLDYLNVQALDAGAWQLALQASQVARDASLTSGAISLGGAYARLRTTSALVGEGASSRLLAVYFGAGRQMHDFRTVQDHRSPRTTSDLLYKGVVANQSQSVYTGLIRVEKGARGTNAYQTNRNLVLHEGAHADSVPNLEIEDNDVRCSHASAVGPIAEDQRFYLESRGIPPEVADRLIALGFLDDVLLQLPRRLGGVADALRIELVAKLTEAETAQAELIRRGVAQ